MKRVLISDVGSALYFVQSFLKNLSFLSYCKAQMEEFVRKHLERAIQIPPQLSSFMVILLLMDVKEVRPRKRRVWSSRGENRDLCLAKELYRKARLGYPEERFLVRRAQRTDSSVHGVVHPAGARVQGCGTQGWEGLAKGRDPHPRTPTFWSWTCEGDNLLSSPPPLSHKIYCFGFLASQDVPYSRPSPSLCYYFRVQRFSSSFAGQRKGPHIFQQTPPLELFSSLPTASRRTNYPLSLVPSLSPVVSTIIESVPFKCTFVHTSPHAPIQINAFQTVRDQII